MTDIDIDAIRQHPDRSIDDKLERVVAERDDLAGALVETERERDQAETKVAELTAALAQSREQVADYAADNHRAVAQLTAANRRADGLDNDLRSAVTANTAYANENARLRSQLAEREAGVQRLIAFRNAKVYEVDELASRLRTVRALAEGPEGEGDFGSVPARDLLNALGDLHPAETRPVVVLDSTDKAEVAP